MGLVNDYRHAGSLWCDPQTAPVRLNDRARSPLATFDSESGCPHPQMHAFQGCANKALLCGLVGIAHCLQKRLVFSLGVYRELLGGRSDAQVDSGEFLRGCFGAHFGARNRPREVLNT